MALLVLAVLAVISGAGLAFAALACGLGTGRVAITAIT